MNRYLMLAGGITATLAVTALFHGPLGAGQRFANKVEGYARAQLAHDEMTQIQARLQEDPLTRHILLSGPADNFQRTEIARRMTELPGVGEASWDPASLPTEARK